MSCIVSESEVEEAALEILTELGYGYFYGPDIAPETPDSQRVTYSDVFLIERLRAAIATLNPHIPSPAREEALKKVVRTESQDLIHSNQVFHNMLVNGVDVEYRNNEGEVVYDKVWLFDFKEYCNNEYIAVNQFTVVENRNNRRPDIVLFINGLPLVVMELKRPEDDSEYEDDDLIWTAYNQFQTYKDEIPSLFRYNAFLIISDGQEARAGTITSSRQWFTSWKTIDGENTADFLIPEMEVLLKGMCNKDVILDLVQNFMVFEGDHGPIIKKLARYHQYHAVNKAVQKTIEASRPDGDRRCGVIWHTQGSGKSLSMIFYAGKLVVDMDNPTIVVITDRNDLDGQLFESFARCSSLLRQHPVQANTGAELRDLLSVASGGIVFTTIQKFLPENSEDSFPALTERSNVIVIADEAHRSQYGLEMKMSQKDDEARFSYGFAKHMRDALPNASFIGFTGTPIEFDDRNTPAIFGDYIDIYDIEQAVKDGVTVKIFYENRLSRIDIVAEARDTLDTQFALLTEDREEYESEKLKSRWSRLDAVVGSKSNLKKLAADIIPHFESRVATLEGKGMIVCMNRRTCVDLYNEIIALRPNWHDDDDLKGAVKVIITGSAADEKSMQPHIRSKSKRMKIRDRMQDPDDPLKIVIVCDMWLTGFDAPCLHTMYFIKWLKGHTLMQAIARVNRVFKDKPGGLIVDYVGLLYDLKYAMANYTRSGGRGKPADLKDEAVDLMLEKYEIVRDMFHGFNYRRILTASPKEKLTIVREGADFILSLGRTEQQSKHERKRFIQHVTELSKAFALSKPHAQADLIRDEVGYFQAVRSILVKIDRKTTTSKYEVNSAIKELVSRSVVSEEIIDVFDIVGIKKPDISILSEDFLTEVRDLPQKNLAYEVLKKLLNDEIRIRQRKNLVKSKSFAEMLQRAVNEYKNRGIDTVQVIEELIELAKKIRDSDKHNEELGLNAEEIAFYDALAANDSAVDVLGDETLRLMAIELVGIIRNNATIDWTVRKNIQAKMRVSVKKLLKKYGYPPDMQILATKNILEQAELMCSDIVATA
ncbi:type I restriction endonuclease subunit R [Methanolobus zinderi]|jgi:type I restriction enzyme R subunit|uniref:type I site-specific deoxyribonuclease n=1 Tax=Methanolobus zinderi TaxID=536044 RepID=A0A7D5E828_9EURY|nr:type I restriction endonuclease subunit R [Methanolobus zinderi]QLC50059.1 type I restriction endonuclease subunit R [Methanolobus zinderi]